MKKQHIKTKIEPMDSSFVFQEHGLQVAAWLDMESFYKWANSKNAHNKSACCVVEDDGVKRIFKVIGARTITHF